MNAVEIESACASILDTAGLPGPFTLSPVTEGANNRVLRVDRGSESYLLKSYFQHPDDPRDRLRTEFAFCDFAWRHGVRTVPRPIASDRGRRLGLYEFVPGRRLDPGEVGKDEVGQALEFFQALNRRKHEVDAAVLAEASEACFSIADHLRCIDARVRKLERIEGASEIDRAASSFIRDELLDAWEAVTTAIEPCEDGPLEASERCLSPSDFGFHNALRDVQGRVRFLDFEYAGWDDPAKLVCDFFCQPAVPIPASYFDGFAGEIAAGASNPAAMRERIKLLLPVYRIKWCCIVLNVFLPVGSQRRRFAATGVDPDVTKADQLRKARRFLEPLPLRTP